MTRNKFTMGLMLLGFMLTVMSCRKDEARYTPVIFVFDYKVDGNPLQTQSMHYTNLAGNTYEVDEVQYFISEIVLKAASGQQVAIVSDSAVHYIDMAIPRTLTWHPADRIPVGAYDSISFIFGINEAKNKTGFFVNPPERDMFWPDMMGGGYHYMKMNGKWLATGNITKAFNFHLGIGMDMMGNLYQNYFKVTLPLKWNASENTNTVFVTMNIEKWFEAPNVWDWNSIGGQIMQNEDAMKKACQNGLHVFSVASASELQH